MRLPWLATILRAVGLDVVEHAGWENRGKDMLGVNGIVWHHTVTGTNWSDTEVCRLLINGRSDLPGPLCQLGLDRRGRYHLIAAGKGNHNGHGTWGNQSIGIEAFNDGVGEPWPAAQLDAFVAGTAAICRHLGMSTSKVLGHKETDPSRKIDPRGIHMPAARDRIAALLAPKATAPTFRRTNSFEVSTVPINTYDVPITTDGNGCGWHKVAIPRDRIIGYTAPGIRPEADGRYVTAEVGFASEDTGTIISVTEWEPHATAIIGISVIN